MTTWGIVSTIRAPREDILRFAAHHLDIGADRIHIFLDEPVQGDISALRDHPRIRVRTCDAAFWKRRRRERPDKHQVRQSSNANLIYNRTDLDWVAHIDVDEFLWPMSPIPDLLRDIPDDIPAVRVRPIEALAGGQDLYKAFIPEGQNRQALVEALYPNFGTYVLAGFMSHIQGKLFVRGGLKKLSDRIHNLYQHGEFLPVRTELPQIDLCHRHAPDWEHWLAHYRFRLERGSYQASPDRPRKIGALDRYELITLLETEYGLDGLREFYDEISAADPEVLERLEDNDMIRHRPLDLDQKVAKHFPRTI